MFFENLMKYLNEELLNCTAGRNQLYFPLGFTEFYSAL
jgi:hypothetical protein